MLSLSISIYNSSNSFYCSKVTDTAEETDPSPSTGFDNKAGKNPLFPQGSP